MLSALAGCGRRPPAARTLLPMGKRTDSLQRPGLREDLPVSSDITPEEDLDLVRLTVRGDFSYACYAGMSVKEGRIDHVSFVGTDLHRIELVDVVVEGADFSGADLEEASLSRVEFVDCRMSGVLIPRSRLHDVRFTECKLDGANFRMSEADRVVFDGVNLRGAEFSSGRFAAARFFDCDLTEAEFSQSILPGAQFHGSTLADIKGGHYLRDIVIDSAQVLPVALGVFAGLGIRVNDERVDP
jgi:Pentapeptide repeats (9 copies)